MTKARKIWTSAEKKLVADDYLKQRKSGMKMVASRQVAMRLLPEKVRYTDSTAQRNQFPEDIGLVFEHAESLYRAWEGKEKPVVKSSYRPPAPPVPEVPTTILTVTHPAEEPEEQEEPTSADFMLLAMRAMKNEMQADINKQLSMLLDLLTAPEGGKQAVEEALLAALEPKKRLPKLVIIGLLNAQMHVVNAKLGHKYRVVNFTSEQTGSASMVASMKGADLVVTFANMVGHHVDDLAMKHSRNWFPHHGGLTRLVEKLLIVKL